MVAFHGDGILVEVFAGLAGVASGGSFSSCLETKIDKAEGR